MTQRHTNIRTQFVAFGVFIAALSCHGCGPTSTDAIKFAQQYEDQLKAQKPTVIHGNNGKWYAVSMDIRNVTHGFNNNGDFELTVNFEFRNLRSREFDSEDKARNADLSPVGLAWERKEELFKYSHGKWNMQIPLVLR